MLKFVLSVCMSEVFVEMKNSERFAFQLRGLDFLEQTFKNARTIEHNKTVDRVLYVNITMCRCFETPDDDDDLESETLAT